MSREEILSPEELRATIGDYKPGSIECIRLQHFMTHSSVVIRPGPRLNLVCGANGTGKSTVLNAICLGLGGSPKVLGRQEDVREYIQHGQDLAEIEVSLTQGPTILRVLDRNKGSETGKGRGASTFFIDGEKATEKQVKECVAAANIAIDNLCTFLPQDKVGSFSGFSDQERLVETEKTLGQELYQTHQELIQAEAEMQNETDNVGLALDNLKRLKHENERFERAVEMQQERRKALQHAELLQKKRIWLAFDTVREEAVQIKSEKDKVKEELKVARETLAPLQEEWEHLSNKKNEMDAQEKTFQNTIQKSLKELEKQKSKFQNHDDTIEEAMVELTSIETNRAKLEQAHREAKERLDKITAFEAQQPALADVDQELKQATAQFKESRREWEKIKSEERHHRNNLRDAEEQCKALQQKLAKMNDAGARKREKIFSGDPKLGKIYQFIDKNRTKFRRPVHGPIACEVTPKSEDSAAFLEQHTPNRILRSFVVETKEDYDFLYKTVREQLKIPINVITVMGGKLTSRSPKISEQKMKILKEEHGVQGFLDDCFTAPDAVRQALRDWAGVQDVLVGGDKTQKAIDESGLLQYLSEPDASLGQQGLVGSSIFASNGNRSYKYTNIVSRYSKKLNSRVDDVGPPRMLAPGVNPRAKETLEEKLSAAHEKLNELRPLADEFGQKAQQCEAQSQNHRSMAEASKQAKEHVLKFQAKLDRARQKLQDTEKALQTDDTAEKRRLMQSIMNRMAHSITALESHADSHEKMMEATIQAAGCKVNASHIVVAERQAKLALADGKQSFQALEADAIRISQHFSQIKKKLGEIKKQADEEAPLIDDNGEPTELKEQLESLELQTLDDVDAAIEEAHQTANRIDDDPTALQEYQRRKNEIEEISESLENLTSSKEAKLLTIDAKRRPWEETLVNHCAKINSLFSTYMTEMGCTGEVRLKKGDEQDASSTGNFKTWGIEILVAFRENNKAQILSKHRHSGGERSVSTIMYLMALQDLMVAPFRCVDEINQGLDDRNERLVFKRIVANSTRKPVGNDLTNHSGQYWLITPKLLPNLTDMEEEGVTVLFVLNGQHNFKSPTDWNVDFLVNLANGKRPIESVAEQDDENIGNAAPRRSKKRRSVAK